MTTICSNCSLPVSDEDVRFVECLPVCPYCEAAYRRFYPAVAAEDLLVPSDPLPYFD